MQKKRKKDNKDTKPLGCEMNFQPDWRGIKREKSRAGFFGLLSCNALPCLAFPCFAWPCLVLSSIFFTVVSIGDYLVFAAFNKRIPFKKKRVEHIS